MAGDASVLKVVMLGWGRPAGGKRSHAFFAAPPAAGSAGVLVSFCREWETYAATQPLEPIAPTTICRRCARVLEDLRAARPPA